MSYKVLARKWRPKTFSEVIGQEHITRTLKNSIISDKIAHAYLLTGTRGIGKTSIVRIFAKAIRCQNKTPEGEPCLVCESCTGIDNGNTIDYLEIDGASNNSVENVRELVESVQYLPTTGKYKVYVIDEVHMLSVSAFNALLKTLEEPPKHVVFLFATTDPQKLLGTVLSRCQRFDFKNAKLEDLVTHLKKIADAEGIKFANDNIPLQIAKQARGSIRDALSLFDQIIAFSHDGLINDEIINLSLGLVENKTINSLIDGVLLADKKGVYNLFQELGHQNIDLKMLANQLLDKLYNVIIDLNTSGQASSDHGLTQLEQVSTVELMWIYENLSKDIEWSLSSLTPESNFCFSLLKMVAREQIVNLDDQKISVKKNSKITTVEPVDDAVEVAVESEPEPTIDSIVQPQVQPEVLAEATPVVAPKIKPELTWNEFIRFLYGRSKSLGLNLERGNLLNDNGQVLEQSNFNIAFDLESKIFYDFLNEPERKLDLKTLLSEFLERSVAEIGLNFQLLNETEKIENNFQSSLEIQENATKAKLDAQREEILNSKYIQDAQNLFDSKISRIILNEENN